MADSSGLADELADATGVAVRGIKVLRSADQPDQVGLEGPQLPDRAVELRYAVAPMLA